MKAYRLASFDVYLIPSDCCSEPYVLTLPIGAAMEVCAHCSNAVLKLVPNYEVMEDDHGLSLVHPSEDQE